jgi:hypothetical protein
MMGRSGSCWRRSSPRVVRCVAAPCSRSLRRRRIRVADASDVSLIPLLPSRSSSCPFLRRVLLIMRLYTSGLRLGLLSFCFLGSAGCSEDNEAAMREQVSRAKGTIPGSRTAQAQTQEEYYEITPGLQGAGTRSGPRPDQGAGYPDAKTSPSASSLLRLARPRSDQGTGNPGAKK